MHQAQFMSILLPGQLIMDRFLVGVQKFSKGGDDTTEFTMIQNDLVASEQSYCV